ncbi:hypothetical protein NDU88_003029 [Pleurodeles waltl]|uniref:Uncharacterized protein n=1 Tax=Pleurodeles waltl TaxID=8319 RepID=A0AAV7V143_PLEWA|nr:hypothetical protein NDU88_003029 [Pleurodeles waltl]
MGTRPPRGRHSEVALTTTDDGAKADWPAGSQRPWIPQEAASEETATEKATSEETATEKATSEETATEKATSEETATEKATSEETATEKATSEEKGGGNGGGGEPRNPRDNPEDGGRPAVQELGTTKPGEAEWRRSPRGPESNEGTTIEPATAPEGRGSGRYGPCGRAEGHLKRGTSLGREGGRVRGGQGGSQRAPKGARNEHDQK